MTEREMKVRWLEAWRGAAAYLEAERDEAIRNTDTVKGIAQFDDAFALAQTMRYETPEPELVALYRNLAKAFER